MLHRQTEGADLESAILFSVYGSKMALFEPRKKFGAIGPLVIAGYREVTE